MVHSLHGVDPPFVDRTDFHVNGMPFHLRPHQEVERQTLHLCLFNVVASERLSQGDGFETGAMIIAK